jgi:hypothetical protein
MKAWWDMTRYILMQRKCWGWGCILCFPLSAYYCISLSPPSATRYQAESDCFWRRLYPSAFVSTQWLGCTGIEGNLDITGRYELVRSKGLLSVSSVYFCTKIRGKLLFHIMITAFLGTFAESRKVAVSLIVSVCLSVRTEQLGSRWTDFHDIWTFFENLPRKFK